MKVLLFNTLYYPNIVGGAERSTQLIAETLLKKGFDVIVICTSKKDQIDIVNGVKVYYVYIPNIFWRYEAKNQSTIKRIVWRLFDYHNFYTKNKISRILKKEKPDVCHTNNIAGFSTTLWAIINKMKIPLVHTIRDYYSICANSKMIHNGRSSKNQKFLCKMYTYNKKSASRHVNAVTGVSKYILETHIKNGYFSHVKLQTYIYNPIEKINMDFVKDKNHNLVFGYFGLISSVKGVELLLDSFKKIKHQGVKLLLAGNENEPNYIKGLKKKFSDNRVEFVGFVKAEDFFKKVDVLIHPTIWHEPFARSIIESFSYKVPVIASYKGGNIEAVESNKTGFLFRTNIELITYINYFIENRHIIEKMKENCIKKANRLLVNDIVNQYINVYNSVT